jgi:hypothetical protein
LRLACIRSGKIFALPRPLTSVLPFRLDRLTGRAFLLRARHVNSTTMSKRDAAKCRQTCGCTSERAGRKRRREQFARPRLEPLEARLLMTATPSEWNLSHGFICSCPICTGQGLEAVPVATEVASGPAAAPLSSLPQLRSNPGATAKLFLDFDNHFESFWGGYSNVSTPVFDRDGNFGSYSDGELEAIYEIWARVAEDYAPFNIDVTTIDPGHQSNQVVAVIAIGGNWSDWYGSSAGGVAYVGGFYNGASNVGYVFDDALGSGNAKFVAEAASHEAGHLFGLQHQANWENGVRTEWYHSGENGWAPIMGVGYYQPRTTWHDGPRDSSPTALQDDMSILANSNNAFGYRADDVGNTRAAAAVLPVSGSTVNFDGLIGRASDVDVWWFSTSGGAISLQLAGDPYGTNLDGVLELWDLNGSVVATAAPSGSLGASLSISVGAGTYYLVARGMGDYGDVGQYTISGSLPVPPPAPEIGLASGASNLSSGGTLSFGTTAPGVVCTRTVTVANYGSQSLNLSALDPAQMPAGFTLLQNLFATSLAPGQATTFVVQLDAAAIGSFSGQLSVVSNDADESPFTLQLAGSVAIPSPATIMDDGAANNKLVGAWKLKSGAGYSGDMRQAAKGTGSASSTWTFRNLEAGQYRVWVTYRIGSANATNAPFTLYNGSRALRTVRVNQRLTPASLEENGTRWQLLGSAAINSGKLVVRLTNAANGQVVADAVRIEPIQSSGSLAASSPFGDTVHFASAFLSEMPASSHAAASAAPSSTLVRTTTPDSPTRATTTADCGPELALLQNAIELLRASRTATHHQSALDQLAADETAWSELLHVE